MFKYEMHLHSNRCSACGSSSAEEEVMRLYEAGYAGAVFTNHFYHGNTRIDRHLAWEEFVAPYRDDYLEAREFAAKLGIDVLFGLEEVYEPGKEALIYGLEPEDIMSEPNFLHMNIAEMSEFVRKKGGFIACAHPFRVRDYIPEPDREPVPEYFDGVEVYNRCNMPEDNRKAADFALKYGLAPISGGDVHNIDGVGFAGLAFQDRIRNGVELVSALKCRDYRLIADGEII